MCINNMSRCPHLDGLQMILAKINEDFAKIEKMVVYTSRAGYTQMSLKFLYPNQVRQTGSEALYCYVHCQLRIDEANFWLCQSQSQYDFDAAGLEKRASQALQAQRPETRYSGHFKMSVVEVAPERMVTFTRRQLSNYLHGGGVTLRDGCSMQVMVHQKLYDLSHSQLVWRPFPHPILRPHPTFSDICRTVNLALIPSHLLEICCTNGEHWTNNIERATRIDDVIQNQRSEHQTTPALYITFSGRGFEDVVRGLEREFRDVMDNPGRETLDRVFTGISKLTRVAKRINAACLRMSTVVRWCDSVIAEHRRASRRMTNDLGQLLRLRGNAVECKERCDALKSCELIIRVESVNETV